jgi:hypothetical protein
MSLTASCINIVMQPQEPAVALQTEMPAAEATGQGLMLLASLSSSWGYHRIPTGKAGYFTLMF